jgi:DnaK suppressor protein
METQEDRMASIRRDLEEEKISLEKQLADFGASPVGEGVDVSIDEGFADSAAATAERSEVLSLIEQLKSGYKEIVDALARMEEGRYGKCERCGQAIPIERLEAIPTARLCVACKQSARSG